MMTAGIGPSTTERAFLFPDVPSVSPTLVVIKLIRVGRLRKAELGA
jgi:hypothetical protein